MKHKPYLTEVNITNQELAEWWIKTLLAIGFVALGVFTMYIAISNVRRLNPRSEKVCAPASLEGKTVTNCLQK